MIYKKDYSNAEDAENSQQAHTLMKSLQNEPKDTNANQTAQRDVTLNSYGIYSGAALIHA